MRHHKMFPSMVTQLYGLLGRPSSIAAPSKPSMASSSPVAPVESSTSTSPDAMIALLKAHDALNEAENDTLRAHFSHQVGNPARPSLSPKST